MTVIVIMEHAANVEVAWFDSKSEKLRKRLFAVAALEDAEPDIWRMETTAGEHDHRQTNRIGIGDIVELKSGGPSMTVTLVLDYEKEIEVSWYDSKSEQPQAAKISVDTICHASVKPWPSNPNMLSLFDGSMDISGPPVVNGEIELEGDTIGKLNDEAAPKSTS